MRAALLNNVMIHATRWRSRSLSPVFLFKNSSRCALEITVVYRRSSFYLSYLWTAIFFLVLQDCSSLYVISLSAGREVGIANCEIHFKKWLQVYRQTKWNITCLFYDIRKLVTADNYTVAEVNETPEPNTFNVHFYVTFNRG